MTAIKKTRPRQKRDYTAHKAAAVANVEKTNIIVPSNPHIYEVNAFQLANLLRSANGPVEIFATLDWNDTDTEQDKQALRSERESIDALEVLGLMKDVSNEFKEQITVSILQKKRGYKVHQITEAGLLMFQHSNRLPC